MTGALKAKRQSIPPVETPAGFFVVLRSFRKPCDAGIPAASRARAVIAFLPLFPFGQRSSGDASLTAH
jgi:hypothetical protein